MKKKSSLDFLGESDDDRKIASRVTESRMADDETKQQLVKKKRKRFFDIFVKFRF